jgi:hypothetical protein
MILWGHYPVCAVGKHFARTRRECGEGKEIGLSHDTAYSRPQFRIKEIRVRINHRLGEKEALPRSAA